MDVSDTVSHSDSYSGSYPNSYPASYPGRVIVDLAAIIHNSHLAMQRAGAKLLGIVKANAYGHGLIESSLAFIKAGASYLGVAQPVEALKIRRAGISPDMIDVLVFQIAPSTDLGGLAELGIDYSVGNAEVLRRSIELAEALGRPVDVQVKLDYGFGRDGFRPEDLASATKALAQAVQAGHLRIRGLWSHFAMAGVPQDPNNAELVEFLVAFRNRLTELGVDCGLVHIANSDSLVFSPQYTFDMVRPGLFVYGFASVDNSHKPADLGIIPVMSFEAELANVKALLPGEGVSYGYVWRSPGTGFLGVIPIGYADGVPRLLKNGHVYSSRTQKLYPIRGTICMDQCFVDLGNQTPPELVPGDRLEFWGQGSLLINDVAQAAGTTHVDLACGFGANLPRFYRNVDALGDLAKFYEFQRLD